MPDDNRTRKPGSNKRRDVRSPMASFLVFFATLILVFVALSERSKTKPLGNLITTTQGFGELSVYALFVCLTGWCWFTNLRPRG